MKFSTAQLGRMFVIRLEDGDRLPQALESFAERQGISCAICFLVGGIRDGGKIVMGPEAPSDRPIIPILFPLIGVHEVVGTGIIFPDETGKPGLHMHAALGRAGESQVGCIRPGLEVWKVGEVVLLEIQGISGGRKRDADTGFDLLEL